MHRRTLLRRSGALGALALAGCTGQASDPESGDGGDDPTPTDTPTETPQSKTLENSSFQVLGREPGSEDDRSADAEFDAENERVVVTGTIVGSDGCKTAALDAVEFDAEADQVTVAVVTEDEDGSEDEACTQSLVAIGYEVSIDFSGGVPKGASVSHDGQGVMSAAHGSSSASAPAGPHVVDTGFEVTDTGSAGSDGDSAVVSFPDDETVRVEGTIVGSNGCKTAALGDVSYDRESDELTVAVVTTAREDAGGCTQALVGIDYVAAVSLGDGLPGDVTVTHDGDDVETVTYQG